mgnify:FL=1
MVIIQEFDNIHRMKKGFYLVFEGIVGCGKTTQSTLLFEKLKKDFPKKEIIWTKEPGGTEIANTIRKVVQATPFEEEIEPVCEQYLYAASRAQALRKVIAPILKRGGIVISDRSFFTSMAYQGFGRGLGLKKVLEINKEAVGDMWPDKVIFVDTKIDEALSRAKDQSGDKFESFKKDFFIKVRNGYKIVAKEYPLLVTTVNGNGTIDDVQSKIYLLVKSWIKR